MCAHAQTHAPWYAYVQNGKGALEHAKEFKDFLVGLGMGWVMEKGGGGLDMKNFTEVKLRNNYKGKVHKFSKVSI